MLYCFKKSKLSSVGMSEEDKLGESTLYLGNLFECDSFTASVNIKLRYQSVDQSQQCQEVARPLISSFKVKNLTEHLYKPRADPRVPPADITLRSALNHQELRLWWYLDVCCGTPPPCQGSQSSTWGFHHLPIVSLQNKVDWGEVSLDELYVPCFLGKPR